MDFYVKKQDQKEKTESDTFSLELIMRIDNFDSESNLGTRDLDLSKNDKNFQQSVEYNSNFFVRLVLPPGIEKIEASFSNNFCVNFCTQFSKKHHIKIEYYQNSGIYHIHYSDYKTDDINSIIKPFTAKAIDGKQEFKNTLELTQDEETTFVIFCPFKRLQAKDSFAGSLEFSFIDWIERR